MFKKISESLAAARYSVTGPTEEDKVNTLLAMGFPAGDARNALRSCGGNVEQAAEILLASASSANNTTTATSFESGEMERALDESRRAEEARQRRAAARSRQSAAASRAGQAAVSRAQQPIIARKRDRTIASHPDVKMPAKLQDKSKEEQLLRCADRMKAYPKAVDTLYIALTALRKSPQNPKFRSIDKTTAGYKRSLEGVPGAQDMLLAMNFRPQGSKIVIQSYEVDGALLYLGISALEKTRESHEYKSAKQKLVFARQVDEIQRLGDISEVEAIRRADFMSKCPTEPSDGRGALVQVKIANESVRRRFDGDDVLQDVLNWLGGQNSKIYENIMSQEWALVDINRYPLAPLDVIENKNKTLQYVGCWPSGRLEILPYADEWKKQDGGTFASSTGLGAAPL